MKNTKTLFRIILLFTLVLLLIPSCSDEKTAKLQPNILLLMSDNQYSEHLGCYGDQVVKTPNNDQMAVQGVRFTNAFCAAPSYSPARGRYALCRQNGIGYPARAIRTYNYLYIRNYEPERWPAGDPPLFGDVDAHMLHYSSPTKMYILENRNDPNVKLYYDRGFEKRPDEELYDLKSVDYLLCWEQIKTFMI